MNSPLNKDIALVIVEGNIDVDDLHQESTFLMEVAHKIHTHGRLANLYTTIQLMKEEAENIQDEKLVTINKCTEVEIYLAQWLHSERDTRAIIKRAMELSHKDSKKQESQEMMDSFVAMYNPLSFKL